MERKNCMALYTEPNFSAPYGGAWDYDPDDGTVYICFDDE